MRHARIIVAALLLVAGHALADPVATGKQTVSNASSLPATARDVDGTSVSRTVKDRFEHLVDHTAGHVNVKSYGATGADLVTAAAAAVTANATLLISVPVTISTAVGTISAPVEFKGNGKLVLNTGGSVTLTGAMTAHLAQVFDTSGGGTLTFSAKVREVVPEWWGAGPAVAAAANTAAIQAALNAAPFGSTVRFAPVTYAITSTGTAALTVSRNVNIRGDHRASTLRVDSPGAGTSAILIAVTDNGGYADVRNQRIEGITIFFNGAGGKHAISIDHDVAPGILAQNNFTITDCSLKSGANGRAVYINTTGRINPNTGTPEPGPFGGTVGSAFTNISHNQIDGGVQTAGYTGDGQRIVWNTIFGVTTGVTLRTDVGTYQHIVGWNTIVTQNGAVAIESASQVSINNNQIEQVGVNAGPYTSSVSVASGADGSVVANNFGGGSSVGTDLTLDGASRWTVRDNVFNVPNSTVDINMTASSSGNVVGFNRYVNGTGNRAGTGFLAVIANSGTGNVVDDPLWSTIYATKSAWALGTVGAAGSVTTTVSVPGAVFGSAAKGIVEVSPAAAVLPAPLVVMGRVSSQNNVTLTVVNGSAAGVAGGTLDFNVIVRQKLP